MGGSPLLTLLAAIIGALPAAAAEGAGVRLGDLVLAYDPDRWEVTRLPTRDGPPTGASALRFVCIAAECSNRAFVWAAVEPVPDAETPACPPDEAGAGGDMRRLDALPGVADAPLALARWVEYSPCRARTPPALRACGIDGGLVYSFGTGANFGCGGIEGVPAGAFAELLAGLRRPDPAVPPATP